MKNQITSHNFFKVLLFFFLLISKDIFAQAFTDSNLPIVVINTNGGTIVNEPKIVVDMKIISNPVVGSRNYLTDMNYNYNGKVGIEFRGSFSLNFPKKSFGIELRTTADPTKSFNAPLLGMSSESDWVLNASYYDQGFLRNVLTYDLYRQTGRYSPNTRFCELVIDGQYQGLYILTEKIKRDVNRVNIAKLTSSDNSLPNLTGGYLIESNHTDVFASGKGWESTVNSQPKTFEIKVPSSPTTDQLNYIKDYFLTFEQNLKTNGYSDPVNGFRKYVDEDSFIDYIIFQELTFNNDAYFRSQYFYKDRGQKMFASPLWDFDGSYGSGFFNSQPLPTNKWIVGRSETNPQLFWPAKMLQDCDFKAKLKSRYQSVRNNILSYSAIEQKINSLNANLAEAKQRDLAKWGPVIPSQDVTFFNNTRDINLLKSWISGRLTWMDANIDNISSCGNSCGSVASCTGTLPSGWLQASTNGETNPAGCVGYTGGIFTVKGGGGSTHSFLHYAYKSISGDATIIAKIESVDPIDSPAADIRGAITFRNSADFASAYVTLERDRNNNLAVRTNTTFQGWVGNIVGAVWVKLIKQGTLYKAQYSSNGVNWMNIVNDFSFGNIATNYHAGLSTASREACKLASATFSNVSVITVGGDALTVSPTAWNPSNASSSQAVSITSNVSWNATVETGNSWLSITNPSGTNNGTITLSATSNTGGQRSGSIKVTKNGGGVSDIVTVTQSGTSGCSPTLYIKVVPAQLVAQSPPYNNKSNFNSNVGFIDLATSPTINPSTFPNGLNVFVGTSEVTSCYSKIKFTLKRNGVDIGGWGPEDVSGSDYGPFGIFGRTGNTGAVSGSYEATAIVYDNTNTILGTKTVTFTIGIPPPTGCGNTPQNYCATSLIPAGRFMFKTNYPTANIGGPLSSLNSGNPPFYGKAAYMNQYVGCSGCVIYPTSSTNDVTLPLNSYRVDFWVNQVMGQTMKLYVNGVLKWSQVINGSYDSFYFAYPDFSSVVSGDRVYLYVGDPANGRISSEKNSTTLQPDDVTLSPNPNNGVFKVSINANAAKEVELFITSKSGKTLSTRKVKLVEGVNTFDFKISEMEGLYLLNVIDGNVRFNKKIAKINEE